MDQMQPNKASFRDSLQRKTTTITPSSSGTLASSSYLSGGRSGGSGSGRWFNFLPRSLVAISPCLDKCSVPTITLDQIELEVSNLKHTVNLNSHHNIRHAIDTGLLKLEGDVGQAEITIAKDRLALYYARNSAKGSFDRQTALLRQLKDTHRRASLLSSSTPTAPKDLIHLPTFMGHVSLGYLTKPFQHFGSIASIIADARDLLGEVLPVAARKEICRAAIDAVIELQESGGLVHAQIGVETLYVAEDGRVVLGGFDHVLAEGEVSSQPSSVPVSFQPFMSIAQLENQPATDMFMRWHLAGLITSLLGKDATVRAMSVWEGLPADNPMFSKSPAILSRYLRSHSFNPLTRIAGVCNGGGCGRSEASDDGEKKDEVDCSGGGGGSSSSASPASKTPSAAATNELAKDKELEVVLGDLHNPRVALKTIRASKYLAGARANVLLAICRRIEQQRLVQRDVSSSLPTLNTGKSNGPEAATVNNRKRAHLATMTPNELDAEAEGRPGKKAKKSTVAAAVSAAASAAASIASAASATVGLFALGRHGRH
ncbi:hypothetical protein BCR44DRAFT_52492 [Catenaria anguillulae PL171]|uniref:Protein kinase domain-containing protein n=1 Tax=Catenaria anguillulae PL171 TaxID=765915 RepID=A0A1Y2HSY3_9FUNG|nr:hypothetical protein BCR44DRAFT_52492 [Catenaria anguillulae PL171]